MRVGRIVYINCYPVYGAIDRGVVPLTAELVNGVPTALNREMQAGTLDVSVISAVEYARDAKKYLLLPDLSICSDGPVRSVMLFSKRPASELTGRRVLVSRSSMTSVHLLELLFENVWDARPTFVPADAELTDVARFGEDEHEARLVIGGDAIVSASAEVLSKTRHGVTAAVVNSANTPTAEFIKNPKWKFPGASAEQEAKVHDIVAAKFAELAPDPGEREAMRKQALALLAAPTIDRSAVEKMRADAVAKFDAKSKTVVAAVLDVADALLDAGYQIHVDTAVEKMKENPSEVVVPLTAAGAGKPNAGRGYVKSFRYTL